MHLFNINCKYILLPFEMTLMRQMHDLSEIYNMYTPLWILNLTVNLNKHCLIQLIVS